MSNSRKLLKEFIKACIEESLNSTQGTVSSLSSTSTSSTKGTNSTSASNPSVNSDSALIDKESDLEQAALTGQIEANNASIKQAGEVAGKVSQATLRMKASSQNIKDRQDKIAAASKTLAGSKKEDERAQAYNDISQASVDMAGEASNVAKEQDIIANAFRRQSDAANKLK